MKLFLTIFISALSVLLELLCGNLGISAGFPVYPAVYFYIAFGPVYGIGTAGVSALLTDVIYCRDLLVTAPVWIVITMSGILTVRRWQRQKPQAPFFSGMVCGTELVIYQLLFSRLTGGGMPGPDILSLLVFHSTAGGIYMLFMTWLFDAVNYRCNLPKFSSSSFNRRLPGGEI